MCRSEWGGGVKSGGWGGSVATKRDLEPYLREDRGEEAYSFTPVSRFVLFSQQQTAGQEVRCQGLRFVMCDK